MKISVIICTYNPNISYLSRVIGSLKDQSLPLSFWELLVIDNNSSNDFSKNLDINWHPTARIIRETTQGLTPSRIRGIREATSDLLIFVDDDNILNFDYLEKAIEISELWPQLGVWGGNIRAEFEVPPEQWTKDFWYYLAIRENDKDYWSNDIKASKAEPCGAGLCLRKSIALHYVQSIQENPVRLSLGRIQNKLTSGEDTDIVLNALDLNFGMGVFKSLKVTHIIPEFRLKENYLTRLMEGLKYSHIILDYLRNPGKGIPRYKLANRIKDLYYLSSLKGRDKKFYQAKIKAEREAYRFLRSLQSKTL